MRVISMSMTTEQFIAGSKDVTRRIGWGFARAGLRLRVVRKSRGLKKGQHFETLGYIELTDVRMEQLGRMLDEPEYGTEECRREGFPNWTPEKFVEFFCDTYKTTRHTFITRLEFKRVMVDDGRKEPDHANDQPARPAADADADVRSAQPDQAGATEDRARTASGTSSGFVDIQ